MSNQILPHQQRMLDEKAQLETRLVSLQNFIDTPGFMLLDDMERHLMNRQAHFMSGYLGILLQRIAKFQSLSMQAGG